MPFTDGMARKRRMLARRPSSSTERSGLKGVVVVAIWPCSTSRAQLLASLAETFMLSPCFVLLGLYLAQAGLPVAAGLPGGLGPKPSFCNCSTTLKPTVPQVEAKP